MTTAAARPLATSLRAVLGLVALVGAVTAAVSVRVVVAGEREIVLSTNELKAGHPIEAIQHTGRAAGWYAPGAPHVRVAYERLTAIAAAAEKLGDRDTALFAWRTIRSAANDSRWIVTPHEDDLERANVAIARLAALAPRPPGTRNDSSADVRRAQLEALAVDESPSTPWIAAFVAGAILWSVGALIAARRAISATGTIDWPRARSPLALTAMGVALYLIAIWRA